MATVPTMVINVVVVGGSQRTHIYVLPEADKVKAEQEIGAIGEALVEPFMGKRALILHSLKEFDADLADQVDIVVSGHSHQPQNVVNDGVLYFNPGSAGPRRFKLPTAVGKLYCRNGELQGEVITLDV